jgi:hypothetical protein
MKRLTTTLLALALFLGPSQAQTTAHEYLITTLKAN